MKKFFPLFYSALFLLLTAFSSCKTETPVTTSLPRSIPELEGVSSDGIIAFLDSAATSRHEFHSIMMLRHGKVVAEGWWNPYGPDLRHTLYSTSKSFTSTAVGFAVTEKLITVNDKVISFFPDDLPDTISPNLAEMTIKDLLTMSAGLDPEPTIRGEQNWVKAFLAAPVVHKPGTVFLYNSMATFMLSAIVQKVTGEKVIDYLTPRLFEPLNIKGIDWEVNPQGINTGGWGLRVKTEDMAKFGQLYLQKGKWNGKQVIPSAWIEEATTAKIDQNPKATPEERASSEWLQGYCYQFWRCRNNCFRADGAYGQYIIVMPEKDAVVAITCESPDMQSEINLVWKYLFPAIKDEPLPENTQVYETLKKRLSSLTLPLAAKGTDSPLATSLAGKTFKLEGNDNGLESVSFNFTGTDCNLSLRVDSVDYTFAFGAGKWITGETTMLGPNLIKRPGMLASSKIACSYSWKDDNTLELVLRYIESPHTITITSKFDKDNILIGIHLSVPPGRDFPAIKGKLVK
jgi:CubicO group peptidase (beta-lactamase class C family)